jgi:zinc protease
MENPPDPVTMKADPRASHAAAWIHALPNEDNILRVVTRNGITILARSSFNSPSISIQGYLPVGSILDPIDKLGLANFTAAALMRGTAHHHFQEIYDELESVGASLGFSCGMLSTAFGGQSLVEDLDLVLVILREALSEPVFPQEQIERLRSQYLTSLAIRAQDTVAMAELAFDNMLFANHPYGRPVDGYPETLALIDREDLARFHSQYYGPQGMVVTVVGGLEPQVVVDAVGEAFQDWGNPSQTFSIEIPDLILPSSPRTAHFAIDGKSQTDVVLGFVGPERRSPDYFPASIANNILGQFGMYGRIGESVREKAGLAYYAYSSLSAGIGPGAWYASAGVDPLNLDIALELIVGEFKRLREKFVEHSEFDDVRTNMIARMPLTLETNAGVAISVTLMERYQLGLDYFLKLPDKVKSVTREDVLEIAQKYLDFNRLVISTAGSKE